MLNGRIQALIVATAIATAAPAAAAPPLLSGNYMASETMFCQILANVDSGTGQITIQNANKQQAAMLVHVFAFDSDAGTYSINGWASDESVIYVKFPDGSHAGHHARDFPANSNSGTYSNTDTTLTLTSTAGVTVNFKIVYGPAEGGVAQSFAALLQHDGQKFIKTCIDNIVAHHQ
jgi:hypothetical protein